MGNQNESLTVFARKPIGSIMQLGVDCITPSQPDDNIRPRSSGPIECYSDGKQRAIIVNGNHRFYEEKRIRGARGKLYVRKVDDPSY